MKTLEKQVFLSAHHYSSILKWTLISSWKHRAPNKHLLVVQSVGESPFLPPFPVQDPELLSCQEDRRIRKPILSYSQKFLLSLKTLSSLCSQQSRVQNKHWHVRLCEMTEWPCRLIKGSGVFHIQLKSSVWTRPVSVVSGTGCSWKTAVFHLTESAVSLYPLEDNYTRCFGGLCTVRTTLVAWIVIHPPQLSFNWKHPPHYHFLQSHNHLPQPRELMDDTSVSMSTCWKNPFLPHHAIKSW